MPAGSLSSRGPHMIALAALLVCFVLQLLGAKLPSVPLLIGGGAAGLALDLTLRRRWPGTLAALTRVHCDETVRQLLRDMLVVIALTQLPGIAIGDRLLLLGGLLLCYGGHFVHRGLAILVRRSRRLPILTRNVDATELGLATAPPRLLLQQPGRRLLLFSVPATAGLLATAATEQVLWGVLGICGTLALSVAGGVYLATWLLPSKRPPDEERMLAWLDDWLAGYRPGVGLYFSGGSATVYQANMWLSTLAALPDNPVIVLRERWMVQLLGATDVPVLCLPRVAHLMRLEHSTLKVLLHPANAPKTSQVLRIPTIKHAFTNHGESDKLSSCNPYAKAYDQVWVAGPAARERYALADVGIDDRDVVEVGRPQLAPVRPAARRDASAPTDGPVTVLYAPTWEGWTDDPGNTSLILAGENTVRTLLADERVRLLYKPHPLTGSVNPEAGAADQRIRALIAEANATRVAAGARPETSADAEAELVLRTDELDTLTVNAFRADADDMERMLLQTTPEPGRADRVEAAMVAWQDAFWAAQPPGGHLILTASRPGIYACFNQADLLITDVSSVVSDFLASAKPYAVINTSGLSEDEFKTVNPTVRAATIIGLSGTEIPHLLATVRDPRLDTLAEARARLKEHLLGPADPPSLTRFRAAAVALCEAAEARRISQGLPPVPTQNERGERSERVQGEQSESESEENERGEENEEDRQAQQDQSWLPTPRPSRTGAAL